MGATLLADRTIESPFAKTSTPQSKETSDYIEPPYLQIVCSQLWDTDQNDPDKTIRLETYQKSGRSKGIVDSYFQNIITHFTLKEKQIASKAFDHLVTPKGTKMAYPAEELADLIRKDEYELRSVLEKLCQCRILRSFKREEKIWYQLYHDVFATIISTWNEKFKAKERTKKAIKWTGVFSLTLILCFLLTDIALNLTSHYFKLSPQQGISGRVEIYRGNLGMWDFFGFRKFEAETVVERHQIEPSRLFDERAIENMGDLSVELFDRLNLVPKISSYFRMGDLAKTIDLINRSIITGKHTQNSRVIEVTAEFRVYDIAENFIKFLTDQNLNNSSIRKKIFSMHRKWGPNLEGIFLKLLDDPDSIIRQEAIGNLVYFLHSDTERAMISCLYDQDALVRRYATFWLGNKKLKRAVANLKLSLFDEDYYVRCLSIWALCRIKDYQAVPSLLLCLWDRNEAVRTQLVNDLPTFGSEVLGPALISSLNYDSYDVKETAIKIMGALKSKEFVPGVAGCLMDPRPGIRSAALDALGKIKHKSLVPYLIKYQWEKAPHLRRPILRILGEIGDPSAIPILVSCLGEDDKYLREEAVEVLAKFGDKRALIPLLDVFSDSGLDISHRDYIYWKYSKLEPLLAILKKNPNEISELLKDSNVLIRNIALEAIGLLGKKSYIPVLAHHLLDDNPEVRRIAVESLGKFEANSSVISILEKSLLDDNPEVRRTVVESLSKFEASSSVVSILEKSVLDEKPEVRKAALEALDNFGSISSTQLFIQSLTDKDIGVSVSSINVLKRLLESNKLKPSEKLKLVLEDLLKIGKNEQRIAAISCLGKFRDKAVAPILLGYLQDTLLRSSVIEALGELGDVRAIPQLVDLLNSPLLDIRRGAIEALGKIGCVSVFPELIRIIS